MKHLSQKLLSLLTALIMVCTLAPAALAATPVLDLYSSTSSASIPYNGSAEFSTSFSFRDESGYEISSSYSPSYSWTLYDQAGRSWSVGSNTSYCTVYSSDLYYYNYDYDYSYYGYTLRCEATVYYNGRNYTDSITWSINGGSNNDYYGSISVSATVYDTNPGYSLGDTDDEGGRSILSQIENALPSGYYLRYVTFRSTSHSNGSLSANTHSYYYDDYYSYYGRGDSPLSDVTFTPSTYRGTASFSFDAYASYNNYNSSSYDKVFSGTMSFKIEEGTAGNAIVYSAKSGDTVYFDAGDFEDFWSDLYSRGSLNYVRFTSVSSGSLYDGSRKLATGSTGSATSCYVNPSSSQTGLDEVSYSPSGSSKSITIRFTAYGSTNSSSSSTNSRSGVVTILYVDSSASPITYNAVNSGGSISLDPDDFTDMYRSVVGSSASTITIQLRSVPSNGALYYQSRALTRSNIGDYTFSSSSRGSYRIADVSYTPGRSGTTDTVEYACYSGGTLRFIGTITFNATPAVENNLVISYDSGAQGVNFNYMDFFGSSNAMAASSYLMFGNPSSGGLYVNNVLASTGTQFAFYAAAGSGYQNLNSLVYKPEAGFNGLVTIAFTAFNSNHTMAANGTVRINVSQPTTPTTPTTPGTSAPGAFKDTPSNAWYASAVSSLVQSGVISGYEDGTFRPNNPVTYGEALKMIMRAAGYSSIQEGTGADWAVNYKNTAVTDGLVSADIVLSAPIDRNAVASIAAKALRLTPVTGGTSPFADTSDGYVLALYQAGIVQGDASSGTAYYYGSTTINRAQISAIIYRINNYKAPVNNTPDTNIPGWLLS